MLDPNLRECLDSPDCIPNPIDKLLKEFKPRFKHLDTSLLHLKKLRNRNLWFLENSTSEDRHKFKKDLRMERSAKYQHVVLTTMYKEDLFEENENVDRRINESLKLVKTCMKELENVEIPMEGNDYPA